MSGGIAPGDLNTETFTNSQGWTVVRVTHIPSGISAERSRSKQLASSVQAQSECIAELSERLLTNEPAPPTIEERPDTGGPVSRAEFDALRARVTELEAIVSRAPG
jgi:hypothetical protein